jgi:hypothetical protein
MPIVTCRSQVEYITVTPAFKRKLAPAVLTAKASVLRYLFTSTSNFSMREGVSHLFDQLFGISYVSFDEDRAQ